MPKKRENLLINACRMNRIKYIIKRTKHLQLS